MMIAKIVSCCLFVVLLAQVEALGSNHCPAILIKRRRTVEVKGGKNVQLAALRNLKDTVTDPLDDSAKSGKSRRSSAMTVLGD
jgi:hypothetical protein